MKKTILTILILISISIISYKIYYVNENRITQTISEKSENTTLQKNENTNEQKEKRKVVSFNENYTDEAKVIDSEYSEFLENKFPISPFLDGLNKEFKSKENVENYLNEVLSDVSSHTMEAGEIAAMCYAKNGILNRLKGKSDPNSLSMKQYYSVMFDKCKLVTGENDIFYIVEKMAQQGDVNQQLNYFANLNSAIKRKIINPEASPVDYLYRRDQGFNWLYQLASRGVTTAYSLLARHYYFGQNIEKDYALAYFYAALANKYDLNSHYDSNYLSIARGNLSEEEYNRVKKISKGEFP